MNRVNSKKSGPSVTNPKSGPPKKTKETKAPTLKQVKKVIEQEKAETETNTAQVDSHLPNADSYFVVEDKGVPCSVYLNWSDLKKNHNKFYIVQVLQKKVLPSLDNIAYLYTRYGRVGVDGVKSIDTFACPAAIGKYHKNSRAKQRKGYTEIKLAGATDDADAAAGGGKGTPKA